ncbi:MAG TPA: acetolactate synthase large subunit [Stellaceae bacterium]
MNGAESLVRTLVASGVEICFANPGTSEMHFVAALDRVAEMRCVLALFEGVVSGAADGYARMAEKPACTLFHLGPGFGNAIANLHNAERARVPIVNIVGEHATYHKRYDAPLNSNIEMLAGQYSAWLRTSANARDVARDGAEAVAAARRASGIATLILPADTAWSEGGAVAAPLPVTASPPPAAATIEHAARMLRAGVPTAIMLSGKGLYGRGLIAAGRIATATGATLFAPYSTARIARGAGLPFVDRVPYVVEQAIERLKEFRQMILIGAAAPVTFFAYPGKSSVPTRPDCDIYPLALPAEDEVGALEGLVAALDAAKTEPHRERAERPAVPSGPITLPGLAATIGALLPENVIVADESITSGRGLMAASRGAPPHDWLTNTGGSIGIGMPLAVGAAIACPDRPVLCLEADGSGMYTVQALWTMAREKLNITTLIFANRAYAILKGEYANVGAGNMGPRALDMLEIGRPDLDWVSLAKGMGVAGTRVTNLDQLAAALRAELAEPGPKLIEVVL